MELCCYCYYQVLILVTVDKGENWLDVCHHTAKHCLSFVLFQSVTYMLPYVISIESITPWQLNRQACKWQYKIPSPLYLSASSQLLAAIGKVCFGASWSMLIF